MMKSYSALFMSLLKQVLNLIHREGINAWKFIEPFYFIKTNKLIVTTKAMKLLLFSLKVIYLILITITLLNYRNIIILFYVPINVYYNWSVHNDIVIKTGWDIVPENQTFLFYNGRSWTPKEEPKRGLVPKSGKLCV